MALPTTNVSSPSPAATTSTCSPSYCVTIANPNQQSPDLSTSVTPQQRGKFRRLLKFFHSRRLNAGGVRATILTLTTSALGAGVLTTPYAFKLSGLATGVIMMLLSALISFISTDILMTSVPLFHTDSYSALAKRSLGRGAGVCVDLIVALNGITMGAVFLIFLGDFIPSAIRDLVVLSGFSHILDVNSADTMRTVRTAVIGGAVVLTYPLSIKPNYGALRHITIFYILSILLTVVIVVCKAPALFSANLSLNLPVALFVINKDIFKSFNICLFAFMQHMNIIPISVEMTPESQLKTSSIAFQTAILELCIYIPLALCGYLSFLSETNQNFINNYPTGDWVILACRLMLSVCLMFAIPMAMISTSFSFRKLIRGVWRLFIKKCSNSSSSCSSSSSSQNQDTDQSDAEQLQTPQRIPQLTPTGGILKSPPELSTATASTVSIPDKLLSTCPDGPPKDEEEMSSNKAVSKGCEATSRSCALPQDSLDSREESGSGESLQSPQASCSSEDSPPPRISLMGSPEERLRIDGERENGEEQPHEAESRRKIQPPSSTLLSRILSVTFILAVDIYGALRTNQVADIVGIIGGFFSVILMCGMPALIYCRGVAELHSQFRRVATSVLLWGFFIFGVLASTMGALLQKSGHA